MQWWSDTSITQHSFILRGEVGKTLGNPPPKDSGNYIWISRPQKQGNRLTVQDFPGSILTSSCGHEIPTYFLRPTVARGWQSYHNNNNHNIWNLPAVPSIWGSLRLAPMNITRLKTPVWNPGQTNIKSLLKAARQNLEQKVCQNLSCQTSVYATLVKSTSTAIEKFLLSPFVCIQQSVYRQHRSLPLILTLCWFVCSI